MNRFNVMQIIIFQFRLTGRPPFFRITAPPEYEDMAVSEVFGTLDWTNETLRNTYQNIILEENAPMISYCIKTNGDSVPVKNVLKS